MKDVGHIRWLLLITVCFSLFSCKEEKSSEEKGHKYTNALINETSPYLLQHAHNPVDWRPWSEEALAEAKEKDKLVLVSIGYSSCHWCHVMERETFEDENIAAIMNENFVNIKVDREERPDVDQVYMTALQLIKGNGGWPLNVITLPNGKPLYGGTYHTNTQWQQVITEISNLYREDPQRANEYANRVAAGVQEVNLIQSTEDSYELNRQILEGSLLNWQSQWDLEWGGNKGVQKFMLPSNLNFLLQYSGLSQDEEIASHLKNTLNKMALGGIYDHLGGGFFRYSTDPYWKVPHFEKMLYDNAQLLGLYAQAYKSFRDPVYKEIVYETFDFLEREMKAPTGGYYAALDADSEGEEGKYYVWSESELKEVFGAEFELFSKYYNINSGAAWEEDKYVLHKLDSDFSFASSNSLNIKEFADVKNSWKYLLMAAREERIRPGLDDKILTSWNALLIEALAEAYKTFGDKKFLETAETTFEFLKEKAYDGEYLIHSYKEGSRRIDGFLDDYAFLAGAALQLYEATAKTNYLDFARHLNSVISSEFKDDTSVLYRYTRNDELISKIVKINDGIMPSPNAAAIRNQFKLGHILYDTAALEGVEKAIEQIIPAVIEDAANYTEWSTLLLHKTYPFYEIAVVGEDALAKVSDLHAKYLPNTLIVSSKVKSELPLFEDRFFEDETYIFVCQNNTCKLPTTSVDDAIGQLSHL